MRLNVINQFLSRNGGGIFTVINELYNSIDISNTSLSDIYFWGFKDEFSTTDSQALPGKKFFFNCSYSGINKLYYSKRFRDELFRSVSAKDIVHLHTIWLSPSIFISKLQKRRDIIKIISTHGMLDQWALRNNGLVKNFALTLFEKQNLNSAACIHALCETEYMDIRKLAPKTPIAIIPNGVNLPHPRESTNLYSKKVKTLLYLGRLHPKKGLENLINGWKLADRSNWKLVISGPDEINYEIKLKKRVNDLNLNESIEFVGPKYGSDKHDLFCNADAFILPSYSEGLPMSVLEAWSYELPVLMTRECNLDKGFEYSAAIEITQDPESVAEGIRKLQNSENDIREMGSRGYNLVKNYYTWRSVSEQMRELYLWVSGETQMPSFVRLD